MQQIVKNYIKISELEVGNTTPEGFSVAPKGLIFHILNSNDEMVDVLDIGFGIGQLAELIKNTSETMHWHVDGIDGFKANCSNQDLINKKIYRNIWYGYVQDLEQNDIKKYRIICLLDVIEHLSAETAKWMLRTLLTFMRDDAYLFVSTPLWFMPQGQLQSDDLEEHLIGIPISSMLGLIPVCYSLGDLLVGGFVYCKSSLKYIELFQPCTNKDFSLEMGMNVVRACGVDPKPGVFYKFDRKF